MSAQLDLEDVAAGHPVAQAELAALYKCRDALAKSTSPAPAERS